jgi:ADP-ribosyl-[dinitrogen reductase] hydrolase
VWSIRTTSSFEDAVVRAINLGGDTDTVAAVCGAMAVSKYGEQRIPSRWMTYVHGSVRQPTGEVVTYRQHDLIRVAHQLLGKPEREMTPFESVVPVSQIHDVGVFASNASGACKVDPTFGVVSLCRMADNLQHVPHRREFYILDSWGSGQNPHLKAVCEDAVDAVDGFLREGKNVLVHCHGGRSRTGLILKAWYMRRYQVDHYEAHEWLEERWPHYVTWNDDFENFLNTEWIHTA